MQFISISIDKKEDEQKWKTSAKKNGLYNTLHKYIVPRKEGEPLKNLLGLNRIPRFVVLDKEGKILNEDFKRPSSGSFELELLKILQAKK